MSFKTSKVSNFDRSHISICAIGLALSVTLYSLPVWAGEQIQTLTLSQAIQRSAEYQQTQGIWKTQQQIATANIKQAKLWINPELSIEQTGFNSDQDRELALGISQRLDVFGERKIKQKRAQIAQQHIELKQQIYQAELELAVKYLWSQLAIYELERQVVQEQLRVSEENLDAIQKRYQAGSVAQVDVDRARLSHAESLRLFRQADLQVQLEKQYLSSAWGERDQSVAVALSPQHVWPTTTAQQVQQHLAANLMEKNRQLLLLDSHAKIEQLKAQARPNPTLNVGVNRSQSVETRAENALVVGVSIPLNLFDRQQYGKEIAQAQQVQLEQQQEFYLKQNALQVGSLLTELQGLEVQFRALQQTQLPLAQTVQQKTLQGFKVGKFALLDVQQATLQLQEVRMRKVQLLKDAWQRALAAESLSLGIDPNLVMNKDAIAQLNQSLWQDTQALSAIGGGN
ncbi:TolC family protein [Acinetobacter sp. ANC 4910]|uniref:TolC family protein n=1 Tax=Acinetobacter sp. ANC 4910 TaxID=2529850 RepID=UPI00103BE2A6|nr:TolC family protein [Acinetobacter sp. ANC 4910]TCB34664.1 TolC family protein [Acinetobacter sp. ANC 4910]